jgi:microsomal dipeptidase-like Zn-dependent dipeptidase
VLGIEVDYLFNSYIPSPSNPHSPLLSPAEVVAAVQHYYDLGVRYVFPIHVADNAFGGTGLQNGLQAADVGFEFGTALGPMGTPYILHTEDGSAQGYQYKGGLGQPYGPNEGRRNVRGLTDLGRVLIQELMKHGMLFDVDHMSYTTRADALDMADEVGYPVVSSHSGFIDVCREDKLHEGNLTADEVDRIRKLGGMVSPIIAQGAHPQVGTYVRPDGSSIEHVCGGTVNTYVQAYLYAVTKMGRGPIGIGTDFNGFAGVPGPTAGPNACPGNPSGAHPSVAGVAYPFVPATTGGQPLARHAVGTRTFDINDDGLADIGLLPDFIAALQALGVTESELEPLLQGATGFVSVWRRCAAGDRLGIADAGSHLYVKQAMPVAGWTLVSDDVQAFALSGDRIGVVNSNHQLSMKEGPITAGWTLVSDDVQAFALSGDRIGVVNSNHQLSMKRGSIQAAWTQEYNGAVRVGLVSS